MGQGYDFRKQSPKVLPNTLHFCPSRRCESGSRKSQIQIHESKPPPVPDPPDPQDQNKEASDWRVKRLLSVKEERTAAPEACQSQSTSTFKASVEHLPTSNRLLETVPWEPPGG